MTHTSPLIATIVAAIGLAFVLGTAANRLRVSPLVGYLLAGVAVGPFTPGFVADQNLAQQLAEIGVILLMFGVGLHFSFRDLRSIGRVAVPGAVLQVTASTLLGIGFASLLGWRGAGAWVFGIALAVASTVVVTRTLQERRLIDTERGHTTIGWLVIQDLLTVVALVLLPPLVAALSDQTGAATAIDLRILGERLGLTLGKVVLFVALMLVVGGRVIPLVLHYVAHTGSRELFRLAVLSLALGVALGASALFGVSFALGAFIAGMTLSESPLSQVAAEEALPLRDAFAVLFFVSVGMLFNPATLAARPWPLLGALALVMIANPLIAGGAVRLFRGSLSTALAVGASLAQIGEFSFIMVGLGISLGLLPDRARDLILGVAMLSILLNPLAFAAATWLTPRLHRPAATAAGAPDAAGTRERPIPTALTDHVVLVGYGRVGGLVGPELVKRGCPLLVIEDSEVVVAALKASGIAVLHGNAADPAVLGAANLARARVLLAAIPDAFEAGQIVEQARTANPALYIVARAHFDAEVDHLDRHGADTVIMGEREIARRMIDLTVPDDAPGRDERT